MRLINGYAMHACVIKVAKIVIILVLDILCNSTMRYIDI